MADFAEGLEQVRDLMREHLGGGTEDVQAEERLREAERVGPCASRFVTGEMDTTGRLTVARIVGTPGAPPSLGAKLACKLQGASSEVMDGVELAVQKALAVGYLAIVETEQRAGIEFHSKRTTQDLWDFWMTECRVMLEDTGIPKSWAKMVRGMGADLLVSDLKRLKLASFLGGSKVNQLGLLYSQAGAHLRMAQTENTPDDVFAERVRLRREAPVQQWLLDEITAT